LRRRPARGIFSNAFLEFDASPRRLRRPLVVPARDELSIKNFSGKPATLQGNEGVPLATSTSGRSTSSAL